MPEKEFPTFLHALIRVGIFPTISKSCESCEESNIYAGAASTTLMLTKKEDY